MPPYRHHRRKRTLADYGLLIVGFAFLVFCGWGAYLLAYALAR
jgi:hypothetical protein